MCSLYEDRTHTVGARIADRAIVWPIIAPGEAQEVLRQLAAFSGRGTLRHLRPSRPYPRPSCYLLRGTDGSVKRASAIERTNGTRAQTKTHQKIGIRGPQLRQSVKALSDEISCVVRIPVIRQFRRIPMYDGTQLCKHVLITGGWVRISSKGHFDHRQAQRPYVRRYRVGCDIVLRLALYTFRLKAYDQCRPTVPIVNSLNLQPYNSGSQCSSSPAIFLAALILRNHIA